MSSIDIALNILGITGGVVTGVGIIIFALFKFLGTIQINRINNNEIHDLTTKLEQSRHEMAKSLTKIENDLRAQSDKQNIAFNMYFGGQFNKYNELWVSIVELQESVDLLWEGVDEIRLASFVNAINTSKKKLKLARPYLDPNDYRLVEEFFGKIDNYKEGKQTVLSFHNLPDREFNKRSTLDKVNSFIEQNRYLRDEINNISEIILKNIGDRLRG